MKLSEWDVAVNDRQARTRNYFLGLSSGYAVTVATIFVGLWLTPFTLRFLDREEFAVFALVGEVLLWLGLLDLGIAGGLNVYAARLTGAPDQERMNRLASTAFFAQLIVAAAVLVCGAGVAMWFPAFFPMRPDIQEEAVTLVLLLVFGSAMSMGTQTFSALLIAHQQIHIDNAIRLILIAVRTVLTVVLLDAGWGLISLAVANVVATLVTAALAVLRTFRLIPGLQLSRSLFSREELRQIGQLGIWFSVGSVAGLVITSMDRIITAKVISLEMVTTLALSSRLFLLANVSIDRITNTSRPLLGQMLGAGDRMSAHRTYHRLFNISTGVAVVVAGGILSGNDIFVRSWVGAENYGGPTLDVLLALVLIAHTWILPNRAILSAEGIVRPQSLARIGEGILNLGLSILFGSLYGLPGIMLGTLVSALAVSFWYLPYLTSQLFSISFGPWFLKNVSKLLILVVSSFGLAFGVKAIALGKVQNLAGSGMVMFLTAVMACVVCWFLFFDPQQRKDNRETLLRMIKLWP